MYMDLLAGGLMCKDSHGGMYKELGGGFVYMDLLSGDFMYKDLLGGGSMYMDLPDDGSTYKVLFGGRSVYSDLLVGGIVNLVSSGQIMSQFIGVQASYGGGVDPIPCVSTHRISDPRSGPAQLLPPHVKQRSHPHGVRPQIPDR